MRAALYLRVSTSAQAEKWSLPAQERALTEHCQREGWTYKVFRDPGVSGETLDQRPGIQQMLKEVAAGGYDLVLAVELERFSRSQSLFDWLTLKQIFRQARVKFGTPNQIYDLADAEDDFLSDLFGSLSKREKQKFLARAKRGKLEAARQGRYPTPQPPFGYVMQDGQLAIHPQEAQIVRHIFTLAREGCGIRTIARLLTREGVPTPRQSRKDKRAGAAWAKSTVFRILGASVYTGEGQWNRRRREGSKHVWRPENEWVAVKVPAIVQTDEWNLVARRLKDNVAFARRNQRRMYLLKGIARCECGGRLYGTPFRDVRYYRCAHRPSCPTHSVKADDLESLVWAEVVRMVQQPQLVLQEARLQRESEFSRLDDLRFKLDGAKDALRKLPRERERALDTYQRGWADQTETQGRMTEIGERQSALEDQIRQLQARLSEIAATADENAVLEDLLARFGQRLARLSEEEKSQVVRGLLRTVTVHANGDVDIEGFIRPPLLEREAKERQLATLKQNASKSKETTVPQKVVERSKPKRSGEAAVQAQGIVPTVRMLWPPAAAISIARLAWACPLTSPKSTSNSGVPPSSRAPRSGGIGVSPSRWRMTSPSEVTG